MTQDLQSIPHAEPDEASRPNAAEYENLPRETLIEMLRRRDSQTPYGLVWESRNIAQDKALNRDFVGLELDPALSCGTGPWRNLIIEGDNYDALRHLVSTYAGQVKLIYIDPPYNTGRKDFVYNDSYFDPTNRYRHSTWLEFMYQRLRLAKDLLAEDGVIFVSIDDNELFNLGLLMNKVFGESNFIANIIWQKVFSPKNTAVHFSDDHEYILVYAADRDVWRPNPMPRTAAQDGAYKNMDNDPRGPWMSSDISARNFYSAGSYAVTAPSGKVISGPPPGRYWTVSEDKFHELNRDNRIWWGKGGNNAPRLKRFLSEVKQGVVPQTLWTYDAVGHTQDAKKQLNEMLPKERSEDVFSTPKPLQLMDRILRLATKPGDLVLDFFAGSGTMAQALLQLNKEDGGERRFILVSNTEATDSEPDKNLCRDVCAARVRRAIEGYTTAKADQVEGLGGNFAYVRARHIPTHRLEERLDDGMVWSFIQMKHHHPLSKRGKLVSVSAWMQEVIIYVPATTAKVKAALREALAEHPQAAVYTWTPAALVDMVNENNLREVPSDLTRGFRFGKLGGVQA
ncbi:site-specific DNA-methyltransferase [Burkholderia singularis]|uniref:site-specific DNA-methyltransferase (adenine-specific) n=1 Tax=Burkholderia singularis TaxID=1503053 RepID=A0A238H7E8_9BURK|nr:site-specific DNA-methyltransferase [Burkholderia singularis]SMG01174.1 Type III restriction-modification system methylation subunit [Burkholderia singularis]